MFHWRALAAAAVCLGLLSPAYAWRHNSTDYYRSSDGSMVHRPTRSAGDFGHVTATCADGTHSYSHHRQGTCSHHGGVRQWAPA